MANKISTWIHPTRMLYALLGFVIFSMASYYAPRAYLQYFDKTDYIAVPNVVTFDRKVYSAGETQKAKLTLRILINSDITLKSRLMLVLMDNEYRVIRQTESEGFVVSKSDDQTYILDAPLPCDLQEGKYLYRAEIRYSIKGIEKYTGFETDLFTINNNRASDSAQIAQNCNAK